MSFGQIASYGHGWCTRLQSCMSDNALWRPVERCILRAPCLPLTPYHIVCVMAAYIERFYVGFLLNVLIYNIMRTIDNIRKIERFTTKQWTWKTLFTSDIVITNRTGHVIEIILSPSKNTRVEMNKKIGGNLNLSGTGISAGLSHEITSDAGIEERQQIVRVGNDDHIELMPFPCPPTYMTAFALVKDPDTKQTRRIQLVENALVKGRREYIFLAEHLMHYIGLTTVD